MQSAAALPLTHQPPALEEDALLIRVVRGYRWAADRCFRERYLHRALLTVPLHSAATAGLLVGHVVRSVLTAQPPLKFGDLSREMENRLNHSHILTVMCGVSRLERVLIGAVWVVHFAAALSLALIMPRAAHRLLAYSAEERTVLLTHCINDIDAGKLRWIEAPECAWEYWKWDADIVVPSSLPDGAEGEGGRQGTTVRSVESDVDTDDAKMTLRDVVVLMRAEEMIHRDRHHRFAGQSQSLFS